MLYKGLLSCTLNCMCQISNPTWHNPCGCINSSFCMPNVTSWMVMYVSWLSWALIRLQHQILAISSFRRAGSLQMCFHKRKKETFFIFFSRSLTKRGEFMKSLTLSWELWVSRQSTVLSHGLIFHQCASHINLTENVLHLKGYEMKKKKHFLLLGAAKHRHHPPTTPHSVFLSRSFSPIHPSYIPLFCFETP